MVTIIQSGNLSAPQSHGLFQDVSFWLSLTVSGRNSLVKDIVVNGGKVIQREQDALILIVDPQKTDLRKVDGPMYSYKFITDSIRDGESKELEEYRVHASQQQQPLSSATSAMTSKSRILSSRVSHKRNPFTLKDDLILLSYITKPGAKVNGNKIYDEIAATHPNHSMHGWRGRWVDYYAKRNEEPISLYRRLRGQAEGEVQEYIEAEPRTSPKPAPAHEPQPKGRAKSPSPPPRLPVLARKDVAGFSDVDDQILRDYSETIMAAEDPFEPWEQLNEQYPHHKASQWRKRYNEKILPEINRSNVLRKEIAREPQPTTTAQSEATDKRTTANGETSYQPAAQPPPTRSPSFIPSPAQTKSHHPKSESAASTATNKSEYISRWRAEICRPASHDAPAATPSPKPPAVIQSTTPPTATTRTRKRKPPTSLPRDLEIPSTPEPEPPHPTTRREPSLELGNPELLSRPAKRQRQEVDPELIIPPIPHSSAAAELDPDLSRSRPAKRQRQEVDPELIIPPIPYSSAAAEMDPDLSIPPISSPTPSRSPSPAIEENGQETASGESSEGDDEDEETEVHRFIAHVTSLHPSVTPAQIAYAIKRTSGVKPLAELVIRSLLRGEGLPDVKGVWSEEDDRVLNGKDALAIKKLAEKKGDWGERCDFLVEWEKAGN